jgi:hypothetical protein
MAQARTVGTIADEVLAEMLKLKKAENKVKEHEEVIKKLKDELKLAAEKEDLTSGGGKKSSFTIEPQIVPHVTNWDAFYEYISENKYYHLLQRRPAVKACQELWNQDVAIPGTDKFTSLKVNVKGNKE